jgi:hypothetical protein
LTIFKFWQHNNSRYSNSSLNRQTLGRWDKHISYIWNFRPYLSKTTIARSEHWSPEVR